MTGYRIAAEPRDPLEVDPELYHWQHWREQATIHGIVTVSTLGIWLPVLLLFLVRASTCDEGRGYAVRLSRGVLTAGTAESQTSVPLDAISRVTVHQGRVSLHVRGGPEGVHRVTLHGLRDPRAAADAILEARAAQLHDGSHAAKVAARVEIPHSVEIPEPAAVPAPREAAGHAPAEAPEHAEPAAAVAARRRPA